MAVFHWRFTSTAWRKSYFGWFAPRRKRAKAIARCWLMKRSLDQSRSIGNSVTSSAEGHDPDAKANLAEAIPTRFVVDTITGASAGGINGIFLAKALVRGESLDQIQQLWVREGAIEKLLNDKLSKDPPVGYDDPPLALLNAKRMYFELLKALDGMDRPEGEESSATSRAAVKKSAR
jgi:hypothetical protein